MTSENSLNFTAQYITDMYGNKVYDSLKNAQVTPANTSVPWNTIGGGGGGSYTSYASGGLVNVTYPNGHISLGPKVIDQLMKEMVTRYTDDVPLVVCVDDAFTSTQVSELAQILIDNDIKGVIISGARAGTGKKIYRDLKDQYQLIDTLGRIAMVWREHPDLNFTDLIKWYKGEDLDDDHFAAAIDVYVKKIYGA